MQIRVLFEWKSDANETHIPQLLAELVGANLASNHPCISVLTDLKGFFCLQMLQESSLYEWKTRDCSKAMRAIAYWLNDVCSLDPSYSYKQEDLNNANLSPFKRELINSFKNLQEKFCQSSLQELQDQLLITQDMSPIKSYRETVSILNEHLDYASMFS